MKIKGLEKKLSTFKDLLSFIFSLSFGLSRRRRFQPLVDPPSLSVPEGTRENEDQVDEGPDTQPPKGAKHQNGGPCLLQIKPVGAETPEKKTEESRCQPRFRRDVFRFHG
jgi:hypothetical protein